MIFLAFVVIAAVFWFVIALNDNVTDTFTVKLNIRNVPDSVTFITDPPAEIHVTLRDKGTNILRSGIVKNPVLNLNFDEYARDGILRLTVSDFSSELKGAFGGAAQITSSSIDSLRCYYTTEPGKRVPVEVNADVQAASGYVIAGAPVPLTKSVLVYSFNNETDTVRSVTTSRLVKKNLSQNSVFPVKIKQIPGVKIVPSTIKVEVKVEALVHKEVYVQVDALNVPEDVSLVLFPPRVPVSFFVPLSRFNDDSPAIHVVVDYDDIEKYGTSNLPVRITAAAGHLINVELKTDSVEYSVVR